MDLDNDDATQLALPFDRRWVPGLDAALDDLRDRFGSSAVTRAVLLGRDQGPSVPLPKERRHSVELPVRVVHREPKDSWLLAAAYPVTPLPRFRTLGSNLRRERPGAECRYEDGGCDPHLHAPPFTSRMRSPFLRLTWLDLRNDARASFRGLRYLMLEGGISPPKSKRSRDALACRSGL
jgi:hypothetical protein